MTDILSAIRDPELGAAGFQVIRPMCTVSQGETARTAQVFPATGCIHPGTPDVLKLLPEEERHETLIEIYTAFPLSLGENPGGNTWTAADRIAWDGRTWKLIRLQEWPAFGYCRGLAVLSDGVPT